MSSFENLVVSLLIAILVALTMILYKVNMLETNPHINETLVLSDEDNAEPEKCVKVCKTEVGLKNQK